MLCLSGFVLYSCWLPLANVRQLNSMSCLIMRSACPLGMVYLYILKINDELNKYVTLMGGVKRSKPASAVLNLLYTESLKTKQDLPKTSSEQAQLTENYI